MVIKITLKPGHKYSNVAYETMMALNQDLNGPLFLRRRFNQTHAEKPRGQKKEVVASYRPPIIKTEELKPTSAYTAVIISKDGNLISIKQTNRSLSVAEKELQKVSDLLLGQKCVVDHCHIGGIRGTITEVNWLEGGHIQIILKEETQRGFAYHTASSAESKMDIYVVRAKEVKPAAVPPSPPPTTFLGSLVGTITSGRETLKVGAQVKYGFSQTDDNNSRVEAAFWESIGQDHTFTIDTGGETFTGAIVTRSDSGGVWFKSGEREFKIYRTTSSTITREAETVQPTPQSAVNLKEQIEEKLARSEEVKFGKGFPPEHNDAVLEVLRASIQAGHKYTVKTPDNTYHNVTIYRVDPSIFTVRDSSTSNNIGLTNYPITIRRKVESKLPPKPEQKTAWPVQLGPGKENEQAISQIQLALKRGEILHATGVSLPSECEPYVVRDMRPDGYVILTYKEGGREDIYSRHILNDDLTIAPPTIETKPSQKEAPPEAIPSDETPEPGYPKTFRFPLQVGESIDELSKLFKTADEKEWELVGSVSGQVVRTQGLGETVKCISISSGHSGYLVVTPENSPGETFSFYPYDDQFTITITGIERFPIGKSAYYYLGKNGKELFQGLRVGHKVAVNLNGKQFEGTVTNLTFQDENRFSMTCKTNTGESITITGKDDVTLRRIHPPFKTEGFVDKGNKTYEFTAGEKGSQRNKDFLGWVKRMNGCRGTFIKSGMPMGIFGSLVQWRMNYGLPCLVIYGEQQHFITLGPDEKLEIKFIE